MATIRTGNSNIVTQVCHVSQRMGHTAIVPILIQRLTLGLSQVQCVLNVSSLLPRWTKWLRLQGVNLNVDRKVLSQMSKSQHLMQK